MNAGPSAHHSTTTPISVNSVVKIDLPDSLRGQLISFRNKVWASKLAESTILAVVVVGLALLTVYCVDRWFDTPKLARGGLFLLTLLVWLAVPQALYRWVWKQRRLEELARLLRSREPRLGDQLLGAIELARNDSEQAHSTTLCAAAIGQVAITAQQRDLSLAAPVTRLKPLSAVLLVTTAILAVLLTAFPAALENALYRLALPWRNTPRFTFAAIEALPTQQIVPHGELSQLLVRLSPTSHSKPQRAHLGLTGLPPIQAILQSDGTYEFAVPPLTSRLTAQIQIGDYWQSLEFEPLLRPQLTALTADVKLPEYLQRPTLVPLDVRSGQLVALDGSTFSLRAIASRTLGDAQVNKVSLPVDQAAFTTGEIPVTGETPDQRLYYRDIHGLAPLEEFQLSVQSSADEPPSVAARELPRQLVVLDSEQINFEALAGDDFGLRRVGISWKGLDETLTAKPAIGEKVISGGGPDQTSIQAPAAFCAAALGITPQPIELRLWVEDYHPQRERIYSSPHVLFVLSPDQHAIWVVDQMSKWHKAAIDVRDKEMALLQENKRLRELSEEELGDEKMRDALRRQAALENANARRLASLSQSGENMLRIASRNPEIGVGHLDRWAEMLQVLNDIGNNRMPSVADLLGDAAIAKTLARGKSSPNPTGPQAGQNRGNPGSGAPTKTDDDQQQQLAKLAMPKVIDQESSLADTEDHQDASSQKKKKPSAGRLTLPTTTIAGSPKPTDDTTQPEEESADDSNMDQAIDEQTDLLAEFQKIADEMNEVLANLEGSTLVKRLKAASREQLQVAEKILTCLPSVFGEVDKASAADQKMLNALTATEETSRQTISYVMDDMQSYFERRRMNQFRQVLDEMVKYKILDALTDLGQAIPVKQGVSIAQAEYWADNLDRWADNLVDPACSGQCPGCKSSDSLPPSLILEALRILESEVNLREATRVAEQARPATELAEYQADAQQLSNTQSEIAERTDQLIQAIRDLPEGDARFPKEIYLLTAASKAMNDAQGILAKPDTGSLAIAAETEAIEWLLQSKKINPRGGGGGGTDPGGGGTGTTQDSALALMGGGINAKEQREARNVTHTTGERTRVLPEEFRQGLDQYFSELERPE